MGDLERERENDRLRALSGDSLPCLSGDLPLSLAPLDGGDLERKRRLPVAATCPPCGGLIGL